MTFRKVQFNTTKLNFYLIKLWMFQSSVLKQNLIHAFLLQMAIISCMNLAAAQQFYLPQACILLTWTPAACKTEQHFKNSL